MAIQRGDLGLLFGLAGFLLGGAAFYHAFRVQAHQKDLDAILQNDGEMIETLTNEKTALRSDLAEMNKRMSALRKELTDGMNDVATVRKQMAAIEAASKDR